MVTYRAMAGQALRMWSTSGAKSFSKISTRASEWFRMPISSARRQPHIQRHHHRPRQHHAVIAFQQGVIVEAQIRHPVAGLYAFGDQPGGQPFRSARRTARR